MENVNANMGLLRIVSSGRSGQQSQTENKSDGKMNL
jgi:hypothetical protein